MARPVGDGRGRIGGRAPGTKNKVTRLNKERIQAFLDENSDEAWECWKEIENPKDKFLAYVRIMEFVVPKMASVELTGDKEIPDWMNKLAELRGK